MNIPDLLIPIRFIDGQILRHHSVVRINTPTSDYNTLVNAIYTCWNQAVFFYPLLDLAEIAGDGSPTACIGLTQWDQSPLQIPIYPFNATEVLQHLNSAEQQGVARWIRVQMRGPLNAAILPPGFGMQDDDDPSGDDDDDDDNDQDEESNEEEDMITAEITRMTTARMMLETMKTSQYLKTIKNVTTMPRQRKRTHEV